MSSTLTCGFYVCVEAVNSVLACVIHVCMIKLLSISVVNNPNLAASSVAAEGLHLKQGLGVFAANQKCVTSFPE